MPTTLRFSCIADTALREANLGAGKSAVLPVGLHGGNIHRSLLRFAPIDWAGLRITRIISAEIQIRNSSQSIVARGASPRVFTWRIIENWSEGTAASLSSGNATRWDNMPDRTSTGQADSGILPTTNGTFSHLPCTDIVKAWAPATVEGGGGKPNYGILVRSYDEAATSRTTEFHSRESAYDPVLVLVVETNTAPTAPINLAPAGDDAIGAIEAGAITFRGERVDPDPADYVTAVEVAAHADGATDGAPGAVIASAIATFTTKLPTFAATLPAAAFTVGTRYRWRARTRDKGGLWSPWSSFVDGRFLVDTLPGPPINRAVDSTSLTPTFYGSIDDADPGATLGAVRIVVYQDTTLGAVLKWDSGFDASGGTRFAVVYGGTPLEVGMTGLRWAAAVRDQYGGEGPLSAFQTWTPAAVTGPDNMTPRTVETKQGTLTPNLTIGHSAAFDAYELEVARFADGSGLLWDVPVTTHASTSSKVVAYAGIALTWGLTYYWRAKVRVAGTTWTEWSAWYPFYVNALPLAPVGSVDGSVDSGGYYTVTTTTPTLRFPYSDPDIAKGYVDAATRREIEIRRADTLVAVSGSPFVITAGITDAFAVPGATLTAEITYEARARYDDGSNQRSPWSEWMRFKPSVAPTVTAGVAVDVADPNPLLDWTFASAPGKSQRRFRAQVYDNASGQLVHDSGLVESAAGDYEVPGDILETGTVYRWTVTVYDTDLLSATLASATWTTAFGTPNALTNLVATPDADSSSVVLAWDATDLDPAYFWRYRIYRADEAGNYVLIGEVADDTTPTYTDGDAPHGTAWYAVTVTNGWAESASVTVATELALRWWIVDPADASLRFEVRFTSGWRADRVYDQESFRALGRDVPVVVSGELMAPAGSFRVFLVLEDAGIYQLLQRAALVDPYVVLKDPFGGVFLVKLGGITQERGDAGSQIVTVAWQVVA